MILRIVITIAMMLMLRECIKAQGSNGLHDPLPKPYVTKSSRNFSNVIGWENGLTPKAPAGFTVTRYASGNPRWFCVLPNGDVLVVESNSYHPFLEKVGARNYWC